jgi:hypothetical protein
MGRALGDSPIASFHARVRVARARWQPPLKRVE